MALAANLLTWDDIPSRREKPADGRESLKIRITGTGQVKKKSDRCHHKITFFKKGAEQRFNER